jgi:hypothetical protein
MHWHEQATGKDSGADAKDELDGKAERFGP